MIGVEYRRTLQEMLVKYRLEPSLRDVYVEGPSDRALIAWFAEAAGHSGVAVYDISIVNVPKQATESLGLPDNNRARVMALSCLFSEAFTERSAPICIVDRDFDAVRGVQLRNNHLLYTDFSCMEAYWLCSACFAKMFSLTLLKSSQEAEAWLKRIVPIAISVFMFRMAADACKASTALPDFLKNIEWGKDYAHFDEQSFLAKYCQKAGIDQKEFLVQLNNIRATPVDDPRKFINGHDVVSLVRAMMVKVFKQKQFVDEGAFGRVLTLLLEVEHCRQYCLFSELEKRVS